MPVSSDLFIAYPLWVASWRGARVCGLAERVSLRVAVRLYAGAGRWGAWRYHGLKVLVEVDGGGPGAGSAPDSAGRRYRRVGPTRGLGWTCKGVHVPWARVRTGRREGPSRRRRSRCGGLGRAAGGGSTRSAPVSVRRRRMRSNDNGSSPSYVPGCMPFRTPNRSSSGPYDVRHHADGLATVVSRGDRIVFLTRAKCSAPTARTGPPDSRRPDPLRRRVRRPVRAPRDGRGSRAPSPRLGEESGGARPLCTAVNLADGSWSSDGRVEVDTSQVAAGGYRSGRSRGLVRIDFRVTVSSANTIARRPH